MELGIVSFLCMYQLGNVSVPSSPKTHLKDCGVKHLLDEGNTDKSVDRRESSLVSVTSRWEKLGCRKKRCSPGFSL